MKDLEEKILKEFDMFFPPTEGTADTIRYTNMIDPFQFKAFLLQSIRGVRVQVLKEVETILLDELFLAQTTTAGKTSRITSALNSLTNLKEKQKSQSKPTKPKNVNPPLPK